MYILTEKQYQIEAEPLLRQVFINEDPFDEPFSPNVNSRMLVYPLYDWTGSIFLKALIKAASDIGDRGIYLSLAVGRDTIADFIDGSDKIVLDKTTFANHSEFLSFRLSEG